MRIILSNLHKKAYACVVGLLPGLIAAVIVDTFILKPRRESRQHDEILEAKREGRSLGFGPAFQSGLAAGREAVYPFVNKELYEKIHGPYFKD